MTKIRDLHSRIAPAPRPSGSIQSASEFREGDGNALAHQLRTGGGGKTQQDYVLMLIYSGQHAVVRDRRLLAPWSLGCRSRADASLT